MSSELTDASEGPIWRKLLRHSPAPISAQSNEPEAGARFRVFYGEYIGKFLHFRNSLERVTKGIFSILRIRHPKTHVGSLAERNVQVSHCDGQDPRIADYPKSSGHSTFGSQRAPLKFGILGVEKTPAYWNAGNYIAGFLQNWSEVYGATHQSLRADGKLADRIRLVYFKNLYFNHELRSILNFLRVKRSLLL